jgi:hypothetical protein
MNANEYDLNSLYYRARQGDPQACIALRRELESPMVHMVRYALKTGKGTTPQARRALVEVRRIAGPTWKPAGDVAEPLVRTVADRVCDAIVADLSATAGRRHWSVDTVPAA